MEVSLKKLFTVNDIARGCSQRSGSGYIVTFRLSSGMDRKMLRDDQWERIEQLLPGKATDRGVTAKDNRRFVEAVLWIMRTGSPWRDLPEELGHWHRTFVRFSRWREKGVWERVATALRSEADMEHLFLDSTIVRAHQHSAGAKKKRATSTSAARGVD